MNLGWTELLLVAGIALLFFGPKRLPDLGKSVGEAIRGFKKGLDGDDKSASNAKEALSHDERSSSDSLKEKEADKSKMS